MLLSCLVLTESNIQKVVQLHTDYDKNVAASSGFCIVFIILNIATICVIILLVLLDRENTLGIEHHVIVQKS